MTSPYRFSLNGRPTEVAGPPMARLLDVLRRDLGLTGTKEGCGEGECGACTVLLNHEAVCSCLVPLFQVEGACTPGMIVTIRALLDRHPTPTRAQVREYVSGTLCRCTGYERIFRAIEVLTGPRVAEGAPSPPGERTSGT